MSSFASASNPNLPYGFRQVQQMKQADRPSDRLTRKRLETQSYFLEKVDPVVSACITYMLCYQPEDIANGMLDYFLAIKNKTNPSAWGVAESKGKVRKDQRVLFARQVGPIISKLVNRIAISRPDDVASFFHKELQSIIDFDHGIYGEEYEVNGRAGAIKASGVRAEEESSKSAPPSAMKPAVPTTATTSIAKSASAAEIKVAKSIQLAFFGLNGGGKSSIINAVQDMGFDQNMKATVGFRPISMQLDELTKVQLYDLGGGAKIRDIWKNYYLDIHGFVYVFDGKLLASGSKEEIDAACNLYSQTITNAALVGKPALVVFNKDDDYSQFGTSIAEIVQKLAIKDAGARVVFNSCKPKSEGAPNLDPRFDSGLNWLMDSINSNYAVINERVKIDVAKRQAEEARQKLEKERRVLRNKIASAFAASIEPSKLPDGVTHNPEEIFDEVEGLAFLAAEIGEEANNLSQIAKSAAAGVGYQRLALQIIGAFKAPISKKKIPMTWEEISTMVKELRSDLGLQ